MNNKQIQAEVSAWGSALEGALNSGQRARLESLFCDPSYFRDNGALTWDYQQFHGRDKVVSTLLSLVGDAKPHNFRISENWPAPQVQGEGDAAVIEAFFDFDTAYGSAVLLLTGVLEGKQPAIKARAIFTRLENLKAIELATPHPRGVGFDQRPGNGSRRQPFVPKRHRQVAQPGEVAGKTLAGLRPRPHAAVHVEGIAQHQAAHIMP